MSLNSQSTYCSSSPFSREKKCLNQRLDKRLTFLTTWPQTKRQKSGRWKHDHAHLSDLTIKDRSPMLHVWSQSVHRRPLFLLCPVSCSLILIWLELPQVLTQPHQTQNPHPLTPYPSEGQSLSQQCSTLSLISLSLHTVARDFGLRTQRQLLGRFNGLVCIAKKQQQKNKYYRRLWSSSPLRLRSCPLQRLAILTTICKGTPGSLMVSTEKCSGLQIRVDHIEKQTR